MKFALLLATVCGRLFAGGITVTTNVQCVMNTGIIAGTSSCSLAGVDSLSNGLSTATISALYVLAGNSLDVNMTGNVNVSPSMDLFGIPTLLNQATSNAVVTMDLFTPGPLRSGFVLIGGSGFASRGVGSDSALLQYSFGVNLAGEPASQSSCTPTNTCAFESPKGLQPIMLGTAVDFNVTQHLDADGMDASGMAFAQLRMGFQLFEADGVTPVDIIVDTPEPRTLSLALIGLLGLLSTAFRISDLNRDHRL